MRFGPLAAPLSHSAPTVLKQPSNYVRGLLSRMRGVLAHVCWLSPSEPASLARIFRCFQSKHAGRWERLVVFARCQTSSNALAGCSMALRCKFGISMKKTKRFDQTNLTCDPPAGRFDSEIITFWASIRELSSMA